MSVFALNFKFDIEETGGDKAKGYLKVKQPHTMTCKQRGQCRESQAKHVIAVEKENVARQKELEEEAYLTRILNEPDEQEDQGGENGMSEQEKIYY